MVGKRTPREAPPLPTEAQPAGSGAVPGTEAVQPTFGERLKANAAGERVAPGVNDDGIAPELAHTEDDTKLAEEDGEPMVRYLGEFGMREITAEQWQSAGVQGMPTVRWERRTGHQVPRSVFTDQALQVLRQDGGFRIS